ncbi:hypothetical protein QBC39DRAFT_435617 [Podospora conica]|nr:hypothetical protein QBC39DRAFT_435617 [Schizothecium conicum]
MARSLSPSCGPDEPAESSHNGGSSPGRPSDDSFPDGERPVKRRRSNTIPDSEDDVSVSDSPDYEDDDTAIAAQLQMDMDATIKFEPASQDEPMTTPNPEPLPYEPLDDYEPFEAADYSIDDDAANNDADYNDTADPFSFEPDDFLERPEPVKPLPETVEEDIPARPADVDETANDVDMGETPGGSGNDAASDTSELSAGFFEDVRTDLRADLDNLVTEAANVKGQITREGCRDIRHTLRKWLVQDKSLRQSDHFYHRLDSAYTEIRFKARVLSKRDKIVVNTFAELARELEIEVFLVIFEREAVDRDVPLIVKQLSDLDGKILVYNVPLEAENLLFDFQESINAAKGKFYEAGLLLVARDSLVDFLMSCSGVPANPSTHPGIRAGTLLSYLKYYIDRCSEPENRPRLLPILEILCQRAWETSPAQGLGLFADAGLDKLLQLLIQAQDWEFFEQVARRAHGAIPSTFFEWVNHEIKASRVSFQDVEKGILAAAFSHPDANHKCSAVFATVQDLDDEHIQLWMRHTIVKIVEAASKHGLGGLDAHSLVYVITKFLGLGQLTELFAPLIKRNPTQTSFLLGVVNQLSHHLDQLPRRVALPLFERLVLQTIDTLDVSQLCSPTTVRAGTARISKASDIPDDEYFHPETPLELCAVSALDLTSFIEALISVKVKDQLLMRLAFKIVNRANHIRRPEFAGLWWPFVRLLADTLQELGIPPTTPRYLNIIMALVEARLLRDVGEQPPVTWGRTKEQIQCSLVGCVVCPQVNEFLAGDAEATSILVPEDSDKHMLELVGPTLETIGCTLEPRPPCLVVRKRFCDKRALAAFHARQEEFKQDLLNEKQWLEPVFQADGTDFDQLIARLSNKDLIVTSAPDQMEEPTQASSPPQAPSAAKEYQPPAENPHAAFPQEAPIPRATRLSPTLPHTVLPPQPYHGHYAVQPVQHQRFPVPDSDFSRAPPVSAQYPQVHPHGAPQQSYPLQQNPYPPQNQFPPQQNLYPNQPWMYNPNGAPAPLDADPNSMFDGLPRGNMGGDGYAPVHPGYPAPNYRPGGFLPNPGAAPQEQQRHHEPLPQRGGVLQTQVLTPPGPGPPPFGVRVKQEFPNPPVRQVSGGAAGYGMGRQGPAEYVDLTFSDD